MATEIHSTAIIERGAELDERVRIGAFVFIGSQVKLAAGCIVRHHAAIEGNTTLGANNEIYPYASIGGNSQDLKRKEGNPGVRIGNANTFREYCTVHAHSEDGQYTRIGSRNYFLAYSHVAHECVIGDWIVLGHNSTLGGHMVVEDHAGTGGHVAIHPFCRLGTYSYIGGCSKVVKDVPPFLLCDGNPAEVRTINKVGLERAGFKEEEMKRIKMIFRVLYREGLNRSQALGKLKELEDAESPIVRAMLNFAQYSERGFA